VESSRTLTFVELVIVSKMMLKFAAVSYENVEMEKFRGKSHCGEIYPLFPKVFAEYFVRDRKQPIDYNNYSF